MAGKTISHYRILVKLGEGGMGVVYKAQDTKLDRIVALKFLPQHLLCDAEAKMRLTLEAKSASGLNHPNITTIHEVDEVEGECFICMEYIEGKSIKERIKEKTFSIPEILNVSIQIAEGLKAAHKKGMVHRDIKSDNIMITHEGLVKIMDFGLAKLKGVSKLTKTGTTLGTMRYMSPEQLQGMEVDQRSDIFSFGVVLYEIIAGQLPFKGEHETAIIYSILNETPEPLARYKAGVPGELQRVVDKALTKNRDERFQHVDDMLADLKSIRRALETASTVHEPGKPKRLKKKLAYICASLAIIIIIPITILILTKHSPINIQPQAKEYVIEPTRKGPFYPQKKGGDCDFNRHGPYVTLYARIFTSESNTQLKAEVKMTAKETKSNWSYAEGDWTVHLYTAESGWYIDSIMSKPTAVKANYTDSNYDWDWVNTDLCNFEVLGDTHGDDICGTTSDDTQMYVNFKQIKIVLRKK
jgi:serine/threonine protein kinase